MSGLLNSLKNLAAATRAGTSGDSSARFSVTPGGAGEESEEGFAQWLHAMRLVARLPAGVPHHFRRKLWLTLAERHLSVRGVDWPSAERACFRGTAHPEDSELGAQIVKDLHRTGCSLFCGTEGRENQAMLRRVLLAYARWNKDVGYCQGFNMLAAIILEVMDKSESDSLKVMIYLVEAVLPEGYFADDLRGLSADMAAFRDLLKIRLPRLAKHMEKLQNASDGGGIEPPLPDVFTMQWFLTLYATWLQRGPLLRIWDLVFLDGNEVLLLTALAIWDLLQARILSARSADEYYSCMGNGASLVWEAGEELVARVVAFGDAPELPRLRDLHRYQVTPPAAPPPSHAPVIHSTVKSVTKRGFELFYSEDEGDSSDEGNKMALTSVNVQSRPNTGDRLSLDIGALKRQYARLRERQRQAHVILAAACARHAAAGIPTTPTSLTVNNLLLGKSAIVSSRGRRLGPPPGAVPPTRRQPSSRHKPKSEDAINWKEEHQKRHLARRDSIKWKDIKKAKEEERKASLESDEAGDGVIVTELEANEMMCSMRSRSHSESSSYSSKSQSSTDTSLCDDNNRGSDFDSEPPSLDDNRLHDDSVMPKDLSSISENSVEDRDAYKISSPVELVAVKVHGYEEVSDKISTDHIEVKEMDALSEYVSATPGEQLRSYLEEFENRKNAEDNVSMFSEDRLVNLGLKSPVLDFDETISKISDASSKSDSDIVGLRDSLQKDLLKTPEFHRKSLSPKKNLLQEIKPNSRCLYDCDYKSKFGDSFRLSDFPRDKTIENSTTVRLPDIIDSLTMSPNFVPDIDLSERNFFDIDSPQRSPGAESIVISEDEHPILLKIDKYFEHSPEFFGARKIATSRSSEEGDIPNRRAQKRLSRQLKKPDSLMLQCNLNEKLQNKTDDEDSLDKFKNIYISDSDKITKFRNSSTEKSYGIKRYMYEDDSIISDSLEKKHYSQDSLENITSTESGRRNSERALQIIQENSKILSRILTKQASVSGKSSDDTYQYKFPKQSIINSKIIESPGLKGSASDSLIKSDERTVPKNFEKVTSLIKLRPISLDEPITTAFMNALYLNRNQNLPPAGTVIKSPIADNALGNRTDRYGWENKGFIAKHESGEDHEFEFVSEALNRPVSLKCSEHNLDLKLENKYEWTDGRAPKGNFSPNTTPRYYSKSVEPTGERYKHSLTSKYSDCLLSRASEICSRTLDTRSKVCEHTKGESSQASDFAFVVTSSMTFSYEPSGGESPVPPKSNSSDTLCQITSLDQISTPISPKIFPKDTPTPKETPLERIGVSPDDTSSQITSLVETESASSISFPRSPSSSSYYPFPARPPIRMPKELGIRLGMYSKESGQSPTK